ALPAGLPDRPTGTADNPLRQRRGHGIRAVRIVLPVRTRSLPCACPQRGLLRAFSECRALALSSRARAGGAPAGPLAFLAPAAPKKERYTRSLLRFHARHPPQPPAPPPRTPGPY